MSKWFKKIKEWYEDGYWTAGMVRNAVTKGKITADEFNAKIAGFTKNLEALNAESAALDKKILSALKKLEFVE